MVLAHPCSLLVFLANTIQLNFFWITQANPSLSSTRWLLQSSILSKTWQCVENLLKAGADPNGGSDGVKALPLAAKVGVIQIIELSVEAGAGPNFTDMGSYLYLDLSQ